MRSSGGMALRRWIIAGSASSTGLRGLRSQPRKPQMNCARSAPSPPSLTTEGISPAAMLRKKSTASSGP